MAEETTAEPREELENAIAAVRQQLGVQRSWSTYGGGGHAGDKLAVAALEDELAELQDALANMEA